MSIDIDFRPDAMAGFYGNDLIKKAIQKQIEKEDKHTYLLYGNYGCGKTTLARIMANMIGVNHISNIRELNIADLGKKDFARELIQESRYKPIHGGNVVIILDEPQESSKSFQEAMLKILEEPPKHIYWILCTTDPQKLKKTIISRCSDYKVEPLDKKDSLGLLSEICEKNNKNIKKSLLKKIYEINEGIPRDMLISLSQIINLDDSDNAEEIINSKITKNHPEIKKLCQLLGKKSKFKECQNVLNGLKNEQPEQIRIAVCRYYQTVCLNSEHQLYWDILEAFSETVIYSGFAGIMVKCRNIYILKESGEYE